MGAIDQGDIEGVAALVQERAHASLARPPAIPREHVVVGQVVRTRDNPDSLERRWTDQGLGDCLGGVVVEGRDAGRAGDALGGLRAEEAHRQTCLRVVVHQEHPPAVPCERAGQVVAGRGLADPALLVNQGDDDRGHRRRVPPGNRPGQLRAQPGLILRSAVARRNFHRPEPTWAISNVRVPETPPPREDRPEPGTRNERVGGEMVGQGRAGGNQCDG